MLDARLAHGPLDPLAEAALPAGEGSGAVVTFTGLARGLSRAGAAVERLVLDHHPRLTEASLTEVGEAALRRFDLTGLRIVHRCGEIAPGEPIVFVAAASAHRRAAFEAADYVMDRLKTDALFWKREEAEGGSAWIEPTDADHADRARWRD